ncbi:galactose ABC transporter substrate-binding protein [Clostridium cellulovorans]|uniref:D-galactose/methyl-galactoside binding periplasmic protein MglB n=1 Tax=Clostridium cellulovorans (strain ATCC 35296 / DSM 3052 / OCM 3 / 743B) TaxID=573061 RepID=D9SPM6_CLOC7|nr:galactose ABC transporter substrate-binding protein [Clostridium cellulovorans]ADL50075.1 D-galactose-binding periplasmic protein precursor [Clostridium cellulovorans 743B]
MKILRRIVAIVMVLIMATFISSGSIYATVNINLQKPVRVAALFFEFNDPNLALVRKNLEDIQDKNKDKVEFTFYNAENNEAIQDATISKVIRERTADLLMVNLVNKSAESVKKLIDEAKRYGIPVVLFNYLQPETVDIIKSYNKAFAIGLDERQAGILQGQIIVDMWNSNKAKIDKNKDNTLQYIMLQASNEAVPLIRTNSAIETINNAGIKTKQLALVNAKWDKELAREAISALFLRYANLIEAIISNNDAMAIGAIEALQKYGYNTGNSSRNILVVGIDAIPEARELVNKGVMTGTIIQEPRNTAEALYDIGMNLVTKGSHINNTNYKLAENGVEVLLPFEIYKKKQGTLNEPNKQ